jgi:hypothetical protein
MSGHPEREGGEGGGATLQHGNPNSLPNSKLPNSRFRVSEFPGPLRGSAEGRQNLDSMLPSVQTPGYSSANSRFRVSEFPGPLRGSTEGSQNPDSMFPHGQIPGYSSANSRFQDSECADSRILLGIFQIPSFRVSEAPSWVRAQGTAPKFQIPSFRVSEDTSWVAARGTHKFPDSKFP